MLGSMAFLHLKQEVVLKLKQAPNLYYQPPVSPDNGW